MQVQTSEQPFSPRAAFDAGPTNRLIQDVVPTFFETFDSHPVVNRGTQSYAEHMERVLLLLHRTVAQFAKSQACLREARDIRDGCTDFCRVKFRQLALRETSELVAVLDMFNHLAGLFYHVCLALLTRRSALRVFCHPSLTQFCQQSVAFLQPYLANEGLHIRSESNSSVPNLDALQALANQEDLIVSSFGMNVALPRILTPHRAHVPVSPGCSVVLRGDVMSMLLQTLRSKRFDRGTHLSVESEVFFLSNQKERMYESICELQNVGKVVMLNAKQRDRLCRNLYNADMMFDPCVRWPEELLDLAGYPLPHPHNSIILMQADSCFDTPEMARMAEPTISSALRERPPHGPILVLSEIAAISALPCSRFSTVSLWLNQNIVGWNHTVNDVLIAMRPCRLLLNESVLTGLTLQGILPEGPLESLNTTGLAGFLQSREHGAQVLSVPYPRFNKHTPLDNCLAREADVQQRHWRCTVMLMLGSKCLLSREDHVEEEYRRRAEKLIVELSGFLLEPTEYELPDVCDLNDKEFVKAFGDEYRGIRSLTKTGDLGSQLYVLCLKMKMEEHDVVSLDLAAAKVEVAIRLLPSHSKYLHKKATKGGTLAIILEMITTHNNHFIVEDPVLN